VSEQPFLKRPFPHREHRRNIVSIKQQREPFCVRCCQMAEPKSRGIADRGMSCLSRRAITSALRNFSDLIRILDSELRLITPVDRSLDEASTPSYAEPSASLNASSNHYQLTHDYLVPSLRDWLTRKQRETRKGRAELRLAERTATWSQKRENKQLATLSEWISIRTLTESKKWTSIERTMMHQAARVHGTWWAGMLIAVLLIGFGLERWIAAERWQNLRAQTLTSVEALQNNLGPSVPFNLEKLDTLPRDLVLPELQTRFGSASNPRHKLSLAFGLAHFAHAAPEYLISRIDDVAESDTGNYLAALASNSSGALKAIQAASAKCVEKTTLLADRRCF
jgi:hypothetical protein